MSGILNKYGESINLTYNYVYAIEKLLLNISSEEYR